MTASAFRPWVAPSNLRPHVEQLAFKLRLPIEARTYIEQALSRGPSRTPKGNGGNVVLKFFSRKMQTTLPLESRTGEYPLAVQLERDPTVIGYVPQAPQVNVPITNEEGRQLTMSSCTPDFLVIRESGIEIIETRADSKLLERSIKSPHQFYRDEQGGWHFRAAETYFAKFGLPYRILANSVHPACLVENERFLEDYISESCPSLSEAHADAIREFVEPRRFVPLNDALDAGFSADQIFKAIADQLIHVDLESVRLAATDHVILFSDEKTQRAHALVSADLEAPLPIPGSMLLKPGTRVRANGAEWVVHALANREVICRNDLGTIQSFAIEALIEAQGAGVIKVDGVISAPAIARLADHTPDQLAAAERKLIAVESQDQESQSTRSLARWTSKVAGLSSRIEKVLALVDRMHDRGNRSPRISDKHTALIERSIAAHYNTSTQSTKREAHRLYVASCEGVKEVNGMPLQPVGYPTYCKHCDRLKSTRLRRGRRAAYQEADIYASVGNAYPVHGVRPHEVCYVDHTIANLATVSTNGMELGKPTLTIAVDGHTTNPRALVMSYDPPSTRTVLMVLRDYVRRHQRLPRVLAVDNGKEFHSKELEDFCRIYEIDLRFRSPGMPRGGSMIESLLGATEIEVISGMKGNTRCLKKDTRLVTKSVDPFRQAEWTLTGAYNALEQYLFEERPNRVHPALGVTPAEYEEKRLRETGQREHRVFTLDENFMLMTSPHARRPFHKVDRQRGIWVDGIWYRCEAMKTVRNGEKVEVRVEPWNASVIYALIDKRWVPAFGNSSRWIAGRTRREVEIVLREESRRSKNEAGKSKTNASARKERVWAPQDFDHRIAAQQHESLYLARLKGMAEAMTLPQGIADPLIPPPVLRQASGSSAHAAAAGQEPQAGMAPTSAEVVLAAPSTPSDPPPMANGEKVECVNASHESGQRPLTKSLKTELFYI